MIMFFLSISSIHHFTPISLTLTALGKMTHLCSWKEGKKKIRERKKKKEKNPKIILDLATP